MTILQHGIAQAAGGGGYQIARSLRFNSADSAYLSRTLGTATNQKKWTWSGWVKRSALPAAGCVLFSSIGSGGGQTYIAYGGSTATGTAENSINLFGAPAQDNIAVASTNIYRDVSALYHVVVAVDTSQTTAANRVRMYVNGVEVSYATSTYPTLNQNLKINSNTAHSLGANTVADSWSRFDGYMTEIYFIDGQQLTPTSFGETATATGVWMPKQVTGMTYGTNGFYLNFSDNSNTTAATLGKDSSGNSNNWTPNNFSVTAGVGNDSLVDSPTNYGTDTGVGGEVRGNYCTLNPLDKGADVNTVVNGNLEATWNTTSGHSIRSTMSVSSGKWYWEFTNANNLSTGIIKQELKIVPATGSLWPGADGFGAGGSYGYFISTGDKYTNGTSSAYGATATTTDVISVALDLDNGKIWWAKNGTWQASGNPATGANAAFTGISGTFSPAWGYVGAGANTISANFGQRPFAYTAPSGFKALCTQNLPTPAIGATSSTLASKNFGIVTYTGDNTNNRAITGVGFQPDLSWFKGRAGVLNHAIYDAVRGVNRNLSSSTTGAEANPSVYGGVGSFDSDGFTLVAGTASSPNTYAETNLTATAFVSWNWKGANTTVSNTSGSITSTVSANPTAGISIVTYTGTGANATVGHGLGAAPRMIIGKRRSAVQDWGVYHASIGNTGALALNLTIVTDTSAAYFNNTSPTSSVFSVGTGSAFNASTSTYVAYCFAEVAGFSKFGSYTGNGSTDGTFVYTGFRPRFIIIKNISAVDSWQIRDTARSTYNQATAALYPNLSNAEGTDTGIDILSNGFKLRASTGLNANTNTFVYAAFAEAPFQYSRAR